MARKATPLPKFEDWKRPWKDEEFDADKAAKLIYNLHVDKQDLSAKIEAKDAELEEVEAELEETTAKVTALEDKDLPEIDRLKRENERLRNGEAKPKKESKAKAEDDDADLLAEKYRIALEKGLSAKDARRLVGKTVEELEEDADAFLEEHGTGEAEGGAGEKKTGKEGQAPPSQRPKVKVRTGTSGDDVDPDAGLDPGALFDKVSGAA